MIYNWLQYGLELAKTASRKSKDPSTQVGAAILAEDNTVLSLGFNGMPRGIRENSKVFPERYERPTKYKYFEHAERNAIYNAARKGVSLEGATCYITAPPCIDCARGLIQVGVKAVVFSSSPELEARWSDDIKEARLMLQEAGVGTVRSTQIHDEIILSGDE